MKQGIVLLFIALILLPILSCRNRNDLEIGFVADFSSGTTDIGTQCRNAVQMAIDEINEKGGVRGRKVSLSALDNRNDPATHKEIVQEFSDRGVQFIIGPFLSRMAASFIEEIKGKELLAISPVVSSDRFARIDDNFFRIQPDASSDGRMVGEALIARGDRSAGLVRNLSNDYYTDEFMNGIRSVLREKGVEILYDRGYEGKEDFQRITGELLALKPDALVFSALGNEAGVLIQQYGKETTLPHLYGDEWTKTTGTATYGGKYVEGMINIGAGNSSTDRSLEDNFRREYESRYSFDPVYFALYSYEAVQMLLKAVEQEGVNCTVEDVKKYLLDMRDFTGILGILEFNEYGDPQRRKMLYIIENSRYVPYKLEN